MLLLEKIWLHLGYKGSQRVLILYASHTPQTDELSLVLWSMVSQNHYAGGPRRPPPPQLQLRRSRDLTHASIPLAQTPWGLTGRAWLQAGAQQAVIAVDPSFNSLGIDSRNAQATRSSSDHVGLLHTLSTTDTQRVKTWGAPCIGGLGQTDGQRKFELGIPQSRGVPYIRGASYITDKTVHK